MSEWILLAWWFGWGTLFGALVLFVCQLWNVERIRRRSIELGIRRLRLHAPPLHGKADPFWAAVRDLVELAP